MISRREFLKRTLSVFAPNLSAEDIERAKKAKPLEYTRGPINKKNISLTFDGDWLDNGVNSILNTLNKEDCKATFFLTGRFMKKYPDAVERIFDEDHKIANHSLDHLDFVKLFKKDNMAIINQLRLTEEVFDSITNSHLSKIYRAPFGSRDKGILRYLAAYGYTHIYWTFDTLDWVTENEKGYLSSDEIENRLFDSIGKDKSNGNGYIILAHVGSLRKYDQFHKKLPSIVSRLKKTHNLVTIEELLE